MAWTCNLIKPVLAVLAFVAMTSAYPNAIHSVQVYTSDCHGCGMSFFGKIKLQISGYGGRTCDTGILDNVGHDDFNAGTISTFTGSNLGQCNKFDLTSYTSDAVMKITHSGTVH